jgi:hypothetical protein
VFLKPYDNQLRISSDDLDNMYLNNEHNITPIKMLIGTCDKQKQFWISRNIDHGDTVIMSDHDSDDSFFTRWKINRSLAKQIKMAKSKDQRIIWFCGGLTQKDRSRVLNQLPNYRKYAVVWEQDIDQMLKDGYERPTLSEGFVDFTYIIS